MKYYTSAQARQNGFQVVKVLIISSVVVLGIVGLVVVLSITGKQKRDVLRVSYAQQLQASLQLYYIHNNSYPIGAYFLGGKTSCDNGRSACRVLDVEGFQSAANPSVKVLQENIVSDPSFPLAVCGQLGVENISPCIWYYSGVSGGEYGVEFYLERGVGDLSKGNVCMKVSGMFNLPAGQSCK